MRWFKHMTDAFDDERLQAYMHECKRPIEAFGFYFRLLEIVAKQMDSTGKCEVTYPVTRWLHLTLLHHHAMSNYMGNLTSNGLVTTKKENGKLTVKIPNLLKYRDEYHQKLRRKSGHTPEQETDTETDTETEQKHICDLPSPPPGRNGIPIQKIVELFHAKLPTLPKVEKLTETRRGYLKQRWREDLPDLDHWENYFHFISQSDFLMGRSQGTNGKPPFRADLEWITKPANYAKIAEEKYHRG